jgi:hemolysin activation/secretion protein
VAFSQPDAGQVLREQQQARPPLPPGKAPDIGLEPQRKPEVRAPAGAAIKVAAFRFAGDLADLSESELQHVVKGYTGKALTFIELQQVADLVSQYLRDKGYSSARAYLAAQEIKDGIVEITILPGRIEGDADGGGIVIRNAGLKLKLDMSLHARLDEKRTRKTIARATVAQSMYLKMDRLERGLLLLNDLPGVNARAQLDPGSTPGTTRVTVDVSEGPLLTGGVGLDNAGNRYTGSQRLNALASLNDPSGNGDQATLQASVADRLRVAKIGYSLPLGYDGLRLGGSYTDLEYRIGEELSVLKAKGSASIASVNLAYPLIRTRRASLFGSVVYDRKALRDESLDTVTADKRVQAWSLVLDGSETDDVGGGGLGRYGLTVSRGDLDLSRSAVSVADDRSGPRAQGQYTKAGYSLVRMQRLSDNWSVFGALSGQITNRNLDSSEKFLLGGATGVRAYPSGEGSGDEGWMTNLELRYNLPGASVIGNWQLLAFYDTGSVLQHKTPWAGWNAGNPDQPNRYQLSGAGVGVSLAKSGNYFVSASYAWKLGSNPGRSAAGLDSDGRQDDSRFWLQSLIFF